jgi:hypothetical protein
LGGVAHHLRRADLTSSDQQGALSGIRNIRHHPWAGALSMLALVTGVCVPCVCISQEKFLVFIPGARYGTTLGVAFTIAFNQFNFALGLVGLPKHETFIETCLNRFDTWEH